MSVRRGSDATGEAKQRSGSETQADPEDDEADDEDDDEDEMTGAVVAVPDQGDLGRNVAIGALVVFVLVFIASRRIDRDTAKNNFAKARSYHKMAENHHFKGNETKAKEYYELAEKSRKRAEEQL